MVELLMPWSEKHENIGIKSYKKTGEHIKGPQICKVALAARMSLGLPENGHAWLEREWAAGMRRLRSTFEWGNEEDNTEVRRRGHK